MTSAEQLGYRLGLAHKQAALADDDWARAPGKVDALTQLALDAAPINAIARQEAVTRVNNAGAAAMAIGPLGRVAGRGVGLAGRVAPRLAGYAGRAVGWVGKDVPATVSFLLRPTRLKTLVPHTVGKAMQYRKLPLAIRGMGRGLERGIEALYRVSDGRALKTLDYATGTAAAGALANLMYQKGQLPVAQARLSDVIAAQHGQRPVTPVGTNAVKDIARRLSVRAARAGKLFE